MTDDPSLAAAARAGDLGAFETLYRAHRAAGRLPATPARPIGAAVLEVNGPNGAKSVPLPDTLVVGRECAGVEKGRRLIVRDPSVSRRHLELHVDPGTGRISATDTSRNGTTLNGSELQAGAPVVLVDGDTLRLGDTRLVLRLSPDGSGPPPRTETVPLPAPDITLLTVAVAVTATGTAVEPMPNGLRTRLVTAAGLFGGVGDVRTATSLLVRWPGTGSPAAAERDCGHYLEFAALLTDRAGLRIDWTIDRA